MELLKKYLIRKIIPFLAMIGSFTAFAISLQHIAFNQLSIVHQSIIYVSFIIVGIVVGVIASIIYEKRGKDILTYNYLGKATFLNQKIYVLALGAGVVGFYISNQVSLAFAIVSAITYGIAFISGLAIGIFDHQDIVSKKLLYSGIVPIVISFIYAYYGTNDKAFIDVVWVFGAVYLYAYLLLVNRMKLNSIIFFKNSINVENSKSIKLYNDILITGFFGIFLLFFNIRKVIEFGYQWIIFLFASLLAFLAKLTSGLLVYGSFKAGKPSEESIQSLGGAAVPMSLITKIVIGVVAVIFFIGIGFVIFVGIKIAIRGLKNALDNLSGVGNKVKDKKVRTKEYEETSEILKKTKTEQVKRKVPKYLYTIKGLQKVENDNDKLRYLYGFALERLIYNHVDIDKSDTPIQVLDKIVINKGGLELNEAQFNKFTEEYRRVRYGYKSTMIKDFAKEAAELEKRIEAIKVLKKKD